MSQPTVPTSKAPILGEGKEEWLVNMKFNCVHCAKAFSSRAELISHYEVTRHDKYSAFKP
ncbi:MAG: hypothetical protein JRN15_14610 [Nitrososphaerota archaeon]|nr:hypothetical protein [Nitrososphaerota archaeon]